MKIFNEKNKKGQFYIIAVLIIISLAIGLLTIENYAKKSKIDKLDDISKELKIEKNYVLDYIASQGLTGGAADAILREFSNDYIAKIGTNKDTVIITGIPGNARMISNLGTGDAVRYKSDSEFVDLGEGETAFVSSTISIEIDGNSYDFNMQEGQNIYYIIKHKYNEEIHITQG
ncbi:MAG: hypothetical protein PF542_02880 [Nanoarchaeota archaeon]|jgi:hypothetical protein|nr:hypothetical protein [Nanoarchaeota archaeon]